MKKSFLPVLFFICIFSGSQYAMAAQNTNYVSLGDSIAAYFGLEKGQGYAELLSDKLVNEGGYGSIQLDNLAQSGDDTQDLLQKIDANRDIISKADIVTICIGGNNFLKTLVEGMTAAVGLTESDLQTQGLDIRSMDLSDERFQIAAKGLQTPEIQAALARGIARFRADFPVIISDINKLAPNAKIYVMTIYDPLAPDQPVYPILDPVEKQMNTIIKATKGITVVDVYDAYNNFANKPQLSIGGVDPHPSVDGQRLIANLYYKAITGKESSDIVEPDFTKKPVNPAIYPSAEVTQAEPSTTASGTEPEQSQPSATAASALGNSSFMWVIMIPVLALVVFAGLFIYRHKRQKGD